MASAESLSSSGADAISRLLPISRPLEAPNPLTRSQLALVEALFEVEWTVNNILSASYNQVALQFPDDLLHVSVPIYQSLRRKLASQIGLYILADTSYGSCCVDEVAAEHVAADVIVHYGHSCLSRPSRIPVLYVFSKTQIDIRNAVESLLNAFHQERLNSGASTHTPCFILVPDVAYGHAIDELYATLQASPLLPRNAQIFYDPIPRKIDPSQDTVPFTGSKRHLSPPDSDQQRPPDPAPYRRYTLPATIPVSHCAIFHVGPESLGLTNLLMTHPENLIISYDPTSSTPSTTVESRRTNKLLMKRYAMVQKARDADVIGILVGTLGVAAYLPLLSHIRTLLRRHHKKSYTLSVGKLNPAKLANFAEIECFVLVACPENSVIDAKEFLRPIVTPFELSLALKAEPSWPGNYILDFEHFIRYQAQAELNHEPANKSKDDKEDDADQPSFSLVTGKYRHAKRYGLDNPPSSTSSGEDTFITLRNADNAVIEVSDSAGADFLQQRAFKGLEQRLGEDKPSTLEDGRSGIARGYQDDHSYK